MSVVSLPGSATSLTLAEAVARFLDRYRDQKHTATTYAGTLTHLRTVAGDASAAGALTPEVFAAAMTRWDGSAPATWNRHLAALRSFAGYALRQEWLTVDPARLLERRKDTARGDKAIPAARLEGLLTDERNALRERVLWRMLYETAARAEEVQATASLIVGKWSASSRQDTLAAALKERGTLRRTIHAAIMWNLRSRQAVPEVDTA